MFAIVGGMVRVRSAPLSGAVEKVCQRKWAERWTNDWPGRLFGWIKRAHKNAQTRIRKESRRKEKDEQWILKFAKINYACARTNFGSIKCKRIHTSLSLCRCRTFVSPRFLILPCSSSSSDSLRDFLNGFSVGRVRRSSFGLRFNSISCNWTERERGNELVTLGKLGVRFPGRDWT